MNRTKGLLSRNNSQFARSASPTSDSDADRSPADKPSPVRQGSGSWRRRIQAVNAFQRTTSTSSVTTSVDSPGTETISKSPLSQSPISSLAGPDSTIAADSTDNMSTGSTQVESAVPPAMRADSARSRLKSIVSIKRKSSTSSLVKAATTGSETPDRRGSMDISPVDAHDDKEGPTSSPSSMRSDSPLGRPDFRSRLKSVASIKRKPSLASITKVNAVSAVASTTADNASFDAGDSKEALSTSPAPESKIPTSLRSRLKSVASLKRKGSVHSIASAAAEPPLPDLPKTEAPSAPPPVAPVAESPAPPAPSAESPLPDIPKPDVAPDVSAAPVAEPEVPPAPVEQETVAAEAPEMPAERKQVEVEKEPEVKPADRIEDVVVAPIQFPVLDSTPPPSALAPEAKDAGEETESESSGEEEVKFVNILPVYPEPVVEQDEILIAVMGSTGVGKSSFINVVGDGKLSVGHGLKSHTTTPQETAFVLDGRRVRLIDTPGFNDTTLSDAEILRTVANSFNYVYLGGRRFTGIIYVHRISDNRVGGSSLNNLKMCQALCGEQAFRNLVFCTTFWDQVSPAVGEAREKELKEDYWADMLTHGASVHRHDRNGDTARDIVRKMFDFSPLVLTIQTELLDEGKALMDTTAGAQVNEQLRIIEEKRLAELKKLEEQMQKAIEESDTAGQRALESDRQRYLDQLKRVEDDRRVLTEDSLQETTRLERRVEALEHRQSQPASWFDVISTRWVPSFFWGSSTPVHAT
ncbi:hypothetical protein BOTBODRAFT_154735 [Botryobasidium botryosum FD-172 SS1]|uniref:G domain-containing protein n=1 Tax=Botryobasidium botryosum (strain FD-172 SS1) TaxID=930990 RepID=A0A067N3N6_BOTB1|nr:hypothetical protein BOTBODRAFT_154735 [Botryobasidium botryosum FD-172 SS1]